MKVWLDTDEFYPWYILSTEEMKYADGCYDMNEELYQDYQIAAANYRLAHKRLTAALDRNRGYDGPLS